MHCFIITVSYFLWWYAVTETCSSSTQELYRMEYDPSCLCFTTQNSARIHQRRLDGYHVGPSAQIWTLPSSRRMQHLPPCRPRHWWRLVASGPLPLGWVEEERFHPPSSLHERSLSAESGSVLPPPEKDYKFIKWDPSAWHSSAGILILQWRSFSVTSNLSLYYQAES